MFVTEEVFQVDNGWLKEVHRANIDCMFVTEEVSQAARDWSKDIQCVNMLSIVVTWETFHVPIGSLK